MNLGLLILVSVVIVAGCILLLALTVIFRKKTFNSCGCAGITYRGERIRCPSCPDSDGECDAEGKPAKISD